MAQAKEREELRARLAKLTQTEEKEPDEVEPEAEEDVETLEAEFEARKKAILEKQKLETKKEEPKEPEISVENSREIAIARLQNSGEFRFELIVQLIKLNKNLENLIAKK